MDNKCRNCKYENLDKRISHDDPKNPEPYEGYAIYCDKLDEYIGQNRAQGLKGKCPYFVPYNE